MESDTERGVGSFGNDGEELSPMMTITSLNRGMDSIVAKAGTLSTLENIKGITSFERKFKRAIDTTPFGCYPLGWCGQGARQASPNHALPALGMGLARRNGMFGWAGAGREHVRCTQTSAPMP